MDINKTDTLFFHLGDKNIEEIISDIGKKIKNEKITDISIWYSHNDIVLAAAKKLQEVFEGSSIIQKEDPRHEWNEWRSTHFFKRPGEELQTGKELLILLTLPEDTETSSSIADTI